jgi:hypothetical protein
MQIKKNEALTHLLDLLPIPLPPIPDHGVMLIATRHLASLSCQTIEIGPNKLGCFSKEVANGLSVCTAVDIPAEFLMATYMNGWDDDDEQEKKI